MPPHDKNVIAEVNKIKSLHDTKWQRNPDKVHIIDSSLDEAYLKLVHGLSLHPEAIAAQKQLKIIYTPLHGTGITMVPKALKMYGFENISIVKEQAVSDGNFPTVKSPNPEEKSALVMAIAQAETEKADLVLATDPDANPCPTSKAAPTIWNWSRPSKAEISSTTHAPPMPTPFGLHWKA